VVAHVVARRFDCLICDCLIRRFDCLICPLSLSYMALTVLHVPHSPKQVHAGGVVADVVARRPLPSEMGTP